ncbi:hypothetical protein TIFTF001_011098 [Ficus carica]|uniref:Uncharacterized protein n=1 Tax=Ficus carica TaxID=3494 RepID=A0AA87ZZB9_FICCA|nr:hypothetical protein TIFTF001_011098 [Ficus carica]
MPNGVTLQAPQHPRSKVYRHEGHGRSAMWTGPFGEGQQGGRRLGLAWLARHC